MLVKYIQLLYAKIERSSCVLLSLSSRYLNFPALILLVLFLAGSCDLNYRYSLSGSKRTFHELVYA